MGDLSSEPSMEDILSSIKRIIAEEGDIAPGRGRRAGRAMAAPDSDGDEILELSDPMPAERSLSERSAAERVAPERAGIERAASERSGIDRIAPPERMRAERAPVSIDDRDDEVEEAVMAEKTGRASPRSADQRTPAAETRAPVAEPMVSTDTVQATRGALDQLSRMLVKPEPNADGTLESMVREMLRPMIREWLDAHLPALAEDMVAREIERITSSRR